MALSNLNLLIASFNNECLITKIRFTASFLFAKLIPSIIDLYKPESNNSNLPNVWPLGDVAD